MTKKIALIKGDGTGPELIKVTSDLLNEFIPNSVELIFCEAGYNWWSNNHGDSLIPEETINILDESDFCLKGPTVTPTTPNSPRSVAVTIRQKYQLYANVRPIKSFVKNSEYKDIDFICVREATEGMYSGIGFTINDETAISIRKITKTSCDRVANFAFQLADNRNWNKVIAIHKANILRETDDLFLKSVKSTSDKYSGIEFEDYFVDNMAQQLLKNPERFNQNVLLSTNLFMDILSEEAAGLIGSIGCIYSANFGDNYAMFEPAHGSAPKYADLDKVNPTATILSAAWLLEYIGEKRISSAIFEGTRQTIADGNFVTYDLGGNSGTKEMSREIIKKTHEILSNN
ncbi:MAG: isocitrate/isopropylmalate dehydrogenase family protein [Thermoproteota archaeon]|jgi:isocitrate dehydrogenase